MGQFKGWGFAFLFLALANAGASEVPILEFHEVSPGIYRGARPDAQGIKALQELNVKTILDLEDDKDAVRSEKKKAQAAGMNFISQPMSGFWAPSDKRVDKVLDLLDDSALYPLFVHCLHGQDRTGLVVGLHRFFSEGWNPADAYKEMLADGFHPILVFLNHYFEERTGYED